MSTFIHTFEMINISGFPDVTTRMLEVESTAGVDRSSVWDTGLRGEPFAVQSVADVASFQAGHNLLAAYVQLTAQGPVVIQYGGQLLTGVLFQVLKVRPIVNQAVLLGVRGGKAGTRGGLVRAEWTLLPKEP